MSIVTINSNKYICFKNYRGKTIFVMLSSIESFIINDDSISLVTSSGMRIKCELNYDLINILFGGQQ